MINKRKPLIEVDISGKRADLKKVKERYEISYKLKSKAFGASESLLQRDPEIRILI